MMNQTNCFEFSKAFDAAFLNELFEGDLPYVVTVFRSFLDEMPRCYQDMQTAFHNNDVPGLKSAAHKAKTVFAYVGLSTISEQLKNLESLCGTITTTAAADSICQDLFGQRTAVETLIAEEIKRMEAFYEK